MKKIRILFLAILCIIYSPPVLAYEYVDLFPSIGLTHYLGETESVNIHIEDEPIDSLIYGKYYTPQNKKWVASVLLELKSENQRQLISKNINEDIKKNIWIYNNNLINPHNNKLWAIQMTVSFFPNENKIQIVGARAYNDDGEMIAFDKNIITNKKNLKYGDEKTFDKICDVVSEYIEQRYQDAVLNSQSYIR